MEAQIRIILSLVSGITTAYAAKKKGQNPYLWLAIGLLLGAFGIFGFFFVPTSKKRASFKRRRPKTKERYLIGPLDRFWYYAGEDGSAKGPISHTALSRAFREGKIQEKTLVWHENMQDWKELKSFLLE